jgi:predicted  nucleic acid-binding Zn-ribbon protein
MLLTDNPKELMSIIDEQNRVIKALMIEIEKLEDDNKLLESQNSELKTKLSVIDSHLEESLKGVNELKEIMNFRIGV